MRKQIAASMILSFILISSSPIIAHANDNETAPDSKIFIINGDDHNETLNAPPNTSLKHFLNERGYELSSYTMHNGDEVSDSKVRINEKIYLFKKSESSTVKKIKLKAPVEEKETDELYIGEKETVQEGKDGEALKTKIVIKTKSSTSVDETIQILSPPIKKIIHVGTKERPVLRLSQESNRALSRSAINQKDFEKIMSEIPDGSNKTAIIEKVIQQVGKPYVWGASGPNSFDCSGLVYWAFAKNEGYSIPRNSTAIGKKAKKISSWKEILPGDVLWTPGHIAIYVGDNKAVHALNPKVGVVVDDLSFFTSKNYQIGRLSK